MDSSSNNGKDVTQVHVNKANIQWLKDQIMSIRTNIQNMEEGLENKLDKIFYAILSGSFAFITALVIAVINLLR